MVTAIHIFHLEKDIHSPSFSASACKMSPSESSPDRRTFPKCIKHFLGGMETFYTHRILFIITLVEKQLGKVHKQILGNGDRFGTASDVNECLAGVCFCRLDEIALRANIAYSLVRLLVRFIFPSQRPVARASTLSDYEKGSTMAVRSQGMSG